jgi:hypothetical protein
LLFGIVVFGGRFSRLPIEHFMAGLVFKYLKSKGGPVEIEKRTRAKTVH